MGISRKKKNDGSGTALEALLPDKKTAQPAVEVERLQMSADLKRLMTSTLTEREVSVLSLRFGLDDGRGRTLEEIGRGMSVTRERVRQIETRALQKLREPGASSK